ncbi:SGNH/GDSL hydrolase family protein [Spirosoma sp. KUDC1026]|uniref:SGNH/GDSL hydrolase family protein n=1 Tax=Spirosoma sp. KUDC1026 TaxID=2745947 RepID=UPI00159BBDC3|nr:SGNH/GDSL hydrolase family protein [Spirosoma sp. KUDC1026]QKZ14389.1 SGNH/GDSL hydrolase family protein [Spirosoma sp. KUDC1026]
MRYARNGFFLIVLIFLSGATRPPVRTWVAIGDSITYLNDHPDETDHRITKGYMTRVAEKLPSLHYVNQGHNGWTAGRIARQIDTLGLVKADIYSIFLGTNDWWAGRPLGRFADYAQKTGNNTVYGSFRIIIDKLRALNPQARILLITPMQRVDFVYLFNFQNNAFGSYKPKNGQTLESFAVAIDSIGQYEHLDVLDLYHTSGLEMKKLVNYKRLKDPQTGAYRDYPYPAFIDIPFDPKADAYPYPVGAIAKTYDGLHPSDKGYALISRKLVKLLKRY